jgi:hypothetical protein
MTTEEKQEIINAVLSAIRTNSKTITQLTPVTEMSDDDYIELSGGRRVAYPVLMAILDTYVTAEAMRDAMLGTADLDSNQVLDWKQSPIVFLESMGADYDDIDGGTLGFNPNDSAVPVGVVYYSPHSGFQIFEKTGESTFLGYLAKTGVCYVNKNTRRFYMWNGSDMAEIGNNKSMKVVIDDMNCSDLNDIAYEQVVYMPLTKKLVVKVGTRKWWSWTPNTNQLYCDKVNNTTLRWEPSSESFVTIGGGGGMSKAVYDAIKNNIEAIRTNFNSLSEQLANLAFKGANPQLSVDAFTWPSQGGGGGDDTPVVVVPELTSPTNGATVNIGVNTGNGITKNITINGSNLAKPLTIGVTGTGFTVTPNSVSAANVNFGTTVAVTYNGRNTGTATGTLSISSTEIGTVQVILTASYQEQGGGEEPTPSEITFTKPKIKLNAAIASTSSGGNIVLDESSARTQHVCCTEYVKLTGSWYKVVIHHDFDQTNSEGALYCRILCKYKNTANNQTAYTAAGVANIRNSNNFYEKDLSGKSITIYRESERLDNSMSSGSYEVLEIAFGVRKNSGDSVPGAATRVLLYASADDANPQVIFAGNDSSTYTLIS